MCFKCDVGMIDGRHFTVASEVMIDPHSDQYGHVVSREFARIHQRLPCSLNIKILLCSIDRCLHNLRALLKVYG